jgi:hypothetical protein
VASSAVSTSLRWFLHFGSACVTSCASVFFFFLVFWVSLYSEGVFRGLLLYLGFGFLCIWGFSWVLKGLLGVVAFEAGLGFLWGVLLYLGFGFHVGFGCFGSCGSLGCYFVGWLGSFVYSLYT